MTRRMNKNAFKHGVYAKDIVLPNESAEEFEQLRQEFRLQFNPIGAPQEAVVRELAGIQWVKDRLNRPLRQSFIHSELIVSEVGTLAPRPNCQLRQRRRIAQEEASCLIRDEKFVQWRDRPSFLKQVRRFQWHDIRE